MESIHLAKQIKEAALEAGYDACGMIPVSEMADYREKVEERKNQFSSCGMVYDMLLGHSNPTEKFPWAKSIVVCVRQYGKYRIPENLEGLIGKSFLCDGRRPDAPEYQYRQTLTKKLRDFGLTVETGEPHGGTAGRFAAVKAGLGLIRKNNFLYTRHGSWVWIDTWLIDGEVESRETPDLESCPEDCRRCVEGCPTKALQKPFLLDMGGCVSRITYGIGPTADGEELRAAMGNWLYGCDACQNACPMNHGKWEAREEFPGMEALSRELTLEKIALAEENLLKNYLLPKFWYIPEERAWLWKVNALRVMGNSGDKSYKPWVEKACQDETEEVRKVAVWAMERLRN